MISVVTPSSASAALPVASLKSHLRLDHSDEDTLLATYAAAAVRALERLTGRSFGAATYRATMPLPASRMLMIQLPDVTAITELKITKPDRTVATVSAGEIVLRAHAYGCLVMPAPGATWPDALDDDEAVSVTLTAGLAAVPEDINAALLLTAARFYADREDGNVPSAALALCGPFRTGGWI